MLWRWRRCVGCGRRLKPDERPLCGPCVALGVVADPLPAQAEQQALQL